MNLGETSVDGIRRVFSERMAGQLCRLKDNLGDQAQHVEIATYADLEGGEMRVRHINITKDAPDPEDIAEAIRDTTGHAPVLPSGETYRAGRVR